MSAAKASTAVEAAARFLERVAKDLSLPPRGVAAVAGLLAEGATVPFIARYRKEVTGSLDEVAITGIRDRLAQLVELETRRAAILSSLQERNLLTPELSQTILAAETLASLEDAYAPFRPKRRTRATQARERGLEPLADWLVANQAANPEEEATRFVVEGSEKDKAVPTPEDALAGARDILAERFSDEPEMRKQIRALYEQTAVIASKVLTGHETNPEAAKYRDYFEATEALTKTPSHRLLAMRRGEAEGHLLLRVSVDEERATGMLKKHFMLGDGPAARQVEMACEDGFKRLLGPSMETDARLASKRNADVEAIRVFAENIRELLLASPMGQKKVLAIDPGFRTGCKVAMLDAQGKLLYDDVIYPTGSDIQIRSAAEKVTKLATHFQFEAVAIGNGTAGRETETFFRALGLPASVSIVMVNESGASVYSASDVAREEFPDKDITVRGAVSIGRRLMDPLAELVKIDPKSIGVGQYQHDVDQSELKKSLDDVVMSCVNGVGVEVNTASKQLLSYVSGLNNTIAENIVKYRNENGAFASRSDLRKVPRLGDKTFEQAAGFLRVRGAANPLDSSAVHPESYEVVEQMARDLTCTVADLMTDEARRALIKPDRYVTDTVGLPTLRDILAELAKPGRDPRKEFEVFRFADNVEKPADLKPGMKLPGIVTNVTAFGAFVDVGVHQDGLVHVSQLADRFVKDASEVVKAGQRVQVTVVEVDLARNRIALSMKARPDMGGHTSGPRGDAKGGGRDFKAGGQSAGRGGGFQINAFADAFNKPSVPRKTR